MLTNLGGPLTSPPQRLHCIERAVLAKAFLTFREQPLRVARPEGGRRFPREQADHRGANDIFRPRVFAGSHLAFDPFARLTIQSQIPGTPRSTHLGHILSPHRPRRGRVGPMFRLSDHVSEYMLPGFPYSEQPESMKQFHRWMKNDEGFH